MGTGWAVPAACPVPRSPCWALSLSLEEKGGGRTEKNKLRQPHRAPQNLFQN